MKSVCVYCGASTGADPVYAEAARELAAQLVERGITLVYGGGGIGLMGIIADEVLRLNGQVIGVIPQALFDQEVGHIGLSQLHIVRNMHERKAMMAELSEGFIAMPGGFGTLEELFEVLTWSQLGLHAKPIGLLNVNGFHDGLIRFVEHLVAQQFLKPEHAGLLLYASNATSLLDHLQSFKPAYRSKTLDQAAAEDLLLNRN
jgi:uncharacterized protein (TIGR00730 family)